MRDLTATSGAMTIKAFSPPSRGGRIVNAMSVDVEEHFQVQALADQVRRDSWDTRDSRVERSTHRVLDLFAAAEIKATFFVLGWVGERQKSLIRRIVDDGHELASHGYEHARVNRQTPEQFRVDIRKTKSILEDAGGVPVRGFRAATFSIDRDTFWSYPIMAEEGYTYSSSISPIRHDLYGIPDAPRAPFYPVGQGIVEYPIATVRVGGRNWGCGGGGFFRILPYAFSKWAIGRMNRHDGLAAAFYFHPWEIDAEQPREAGLPFKSRFRHYLNLDRMADRLSVLLRDFAWDRIDRVFGDGTGR